MPLAIPLPPLTSRWANVPDGSPALIWRQYLLATDADMRALDGQVATHTTQIATLNSQVGGILAATPQISGGLVASPGAISSPTNQMLGLSNLNAANIITPATTGRIIVHASGVVAQSTNNDGARWHIRTGTGTAPANGAGLTGTQSGGEQSMHFITGVLQVPFALQTIVTGLTLGTAAWIDLTLGVITGGTATMTQVNISAFEI